MILRAPGWPTRVIAAGLAPFALAACSEPPGAAPGAVSEGEARALEEAAEMLDERRLPEGAVPDIDAPADGDAAAERTAEMTGDNSD